MMSQFTLHTLESAPEQTKAMLQGSLDTFGFIPNLYANLAESPQALLAYPQITELFNQSSLNPIEQQVVLLTASVENQCEFCVAAHSVIAKNMVKVPADVVESIRNGQPIADKKLNALAVFTQLAVSQRGWVNGEPTDAFIAAGYSQQAALDVILGVTLKTLSTYANHLTGTKINDAFASEAWSKD